jgi:hypothetical protein
MKKAIIGMRLLAVLFAICVVSFGATRARADVEAHGVLVPAGVFNTMANGTFSVPYTVKSADTDVIVVGIVVDATPTADVTNFQFGGVAPTGVQLNNQRTTMAYWSVSGLAVNQVINITGTHSVMAASQSNGYVWELSDIVLASGVDTDAIGSELPIVNSMTTSSNGRLVTSFAGGNKQDGSVAPQGDSVISQFNSYQFGGGGGGTTAGGVGTAGPAGENTLGWVTVTGGGANGVFSELAFAFDAPGTIVPYINLTVDRATGQMTLNRVGPTIANVVGYTITSAAGSLIQAGWKSVADNYDGAGTVGGGQWTKLTQPGSVSDLSEFTFDESDADGGQIVEGSLVLGNAGAWKRTPYQDLQMTIAITDGTTSSTMSVPVKYTGAAILRSDFDLDGDIDGTDMNVFLTNYNTSIPTTTLDAISYSSGDINGDQAVNLADWRLFKADLNDYINASGGGASVDGGQVPEPTTLMLLCVTISGLGLAARRRRLL